MSKNKLFWLVLLSVAVVAVLSAGTLAAYSITDVLQGSLRAARMVFTINGSGEETQSLGVRELKPGESTTFDIVLQTQGTETAMDISLRVAASGSDLPPGISVRVDGTSVGSSGTGSVTKEYLDVSGSTRTVPVVVSWATTADQLKTQYSQSKNFTLSLEATATATQKN